MTVSIMDERGDENSGWTVGRAFAWVAGTLVAIFVTGVAAGYLAAHLNRTTGTREWSDRADLAIPVLVIGLIATAALLAFRRHWPRRAPAGSSEWQHRAAGRARRTMTVWAGTFATIGIAMVSILLAGQVGVDAIGGRLLLALGLVMAAVGTIWGTFIYMKVIDEQERQANLYAGYAGLTTYLLLEFLQFLLGRVGADLDVPRLDGAIFNATLLVALTTFCIKRFR